MRIWNQCALPIPPPSAPAARPLTLTRSLSALKTNLAPEAEADLRTALVRRLARGCIYSGNGNIFALEERPLPATPGQTSTPATLCYYCLVRADADEDTDAGSPGEFLVRHRCLLLAVCC